MKSTIYNVTNETWIVDYIQKISELFHGSYYNPNFIKILIDECNKFESHTEITEVQLNRMKEAAYSRARTDIDIYGNLTSKVSCSSDDVVSFIRQLQEVDNKSAFVLELTKEYYSTLDVMTLTEQNVDDILHVVLNKSHIEIDQYGNLFRDSFIYSIANILQKTNRIVAAILEHNAQNICNEKGDFDFLSRINIEIGLLHQDMILAIDVIKNKIERLRLSDIKSEAGKSSTRICEGIIQAVINLRKYPHYSDNTARILHVFKASSITRPLFVNKYKIYRNGDTIIEVNANDEKEISVSTLKRRYIETYSTNQIYINKYGAIPECFKWVDSIGHLHHFAGDQDLAGAKSPQ